jgi:anti-sigma factor RsiW
MNCDDCRQQTEAYFDGELDARTTERVATHLAACAACASLFDELQDEAEVYKTYERDIELSPALWTAIESRLANDFVALRAQESHPTSWLREWWAWAFASPRLAFGATAAVVAIFACLIASAALLNGNRESASQTEIVGVQSQAEQPTVPGQILAESNTNLARESITEGQDRVSRKPTAHQQAKPSRIHASIKNKEANIIAGDKGKRVTTRGALAGNHHRIEPHTERAFTPAITTTPDVVVAKIAERLNQTPGDFEDVWQRHAEQSQLLLRSFRNARSGRGKTVDVAYERAQAQRLLGRNVILRRDAARRGRVLTEDSLSRLEPVLLDIANLPAKASPEDVRAVNARINEGEFVATLRVQANLLARSN